MNTDDKTIIATTVSHVEYLIEIVERSDPAMDLQDEGYQLLRRRIIGSVRHFALVDIEAIESMPETGVAGLIDEFNINTALLKSVVIAAKDDDAWESLRSGILSAATKINTH